MIRWCVYTKAATCNSPQKLFVFVGELLEAKSVSARENVDEAGFIAKYQMLEKDPAKNFVY